MTKTIHDYKSAFDELDIKCNLIGDKALEAVKQDGGALQYVKKQSEAICLEAVKQNGDALQYVKEQSEAICLEAVKQNGGALQYVNERIFEKNNITNTNIYNDTINKLEELLTFLKGKQND